MNPSAPGWILKHKPLITKWLLANQPGADDFYTQLVKTGFIYGVSVSTCVYKNHEPLKWDETERAKINLFDALFFTYHLKYDNTNLFFKEVNTFYTLLNSQEKSYFSGFIKAKQTAADLEKIIQNRLQTNEALLQRNFSNLITNALLFLDVVVFEWYLDHKSEDVKAYAAQFEALLMQLIWMALNQKQQKDNYDKLLLKLFEKSLRYNSNLDKTITDLDKLELTAYTTLFARRYILDLAALAVWDDLKMDSNELEFLEELGSKLNFETQVTQNAISCVQEFIVSNRNEISYLNYSNPVKHFYNQTSKTVRTLIIRNKKRLLLELSGSKDLVILLGYSTVRDLSKAEKKRVKTQLLDICKSVPSLAIFMLPGGGVLLPLLIKFIPELLPSAFNENRTEEEDI
ncbi:LETM1-related biofilm-associated protein [Leeuwenhoekiella sp. H156]|uniref:LETM1-related biofilm-associated protein n=1 Tax=Leeuwenhoekiella sp. H156 TaxID=3450128 RepID=UPI003FA4AADD